MLELIGDNLHSSLKVWFGEVESETELRSGQGQDCLQCVVPDISHFYPPGCTWLSNPTQVHLLSILHSSSQDEKMSGVTESGQT